MMVELKCAYQTRPKLCFPIQMRYPFLIYTADAISIFIIYCRCHIHFYYILQIRYPFLLYTADAISIFIIYCRCDIHFLLYTADVISIFIIYCRCDIHFYYILKMWYPFLLYTADAISIFIIYLLHIALFELSAFQISFFILGVNSTILVFPQDFICLRRCSKMLRRSKVLTAVCQYKDWNLSV